MNNATSLRSKLNQISKQQQIAFQLLIFRYLHERLLYRLSISSYKNTFYLKGGALLYAFGGLISRPTKDIDLTVSELNNDKDEMKLIFQNICNISYPTDFVNFDSTSIITENINETNINHGVRVFVNGTFDTIKQRIQIDICFGDAITPDSNEIDYPTLFSEMESPLVKCYSIENIIAEKFQAMIAFSTTNSRMKDFYDVYMLLDSRKYDNIILGQAIKATFKNRQTRYVDNHDLFSEEFATNKQRIVMWNSFLKKINEKEKYSFPEIMSALKQILYPIWITL